MNLGEKKKFIINFTYFFIWCAIVYLILKVAAVYLLPFIIGIIIAYAVQKPSELLSKKTNLKKENFAAILSVLVFISVIILIAVLGWFLYNQFSSFIGLFMVRSASFKNYIEQAYEWLQRLFRSIDGEFDGTLNKLTNDTVSSFINKLGVILSNTTTTFIKKLPTIIISSVVTVVATCYISKEYGNLIKFIKGFLNDKIIKKIVDIRNIFTECFFKFLVGYFWLFMITCLELSIGFLILKIEHFIVIAFLISLLDLLPIIGTGAVLLPWAAFSFFENDYKLGFGLVILYFIVTVLRNFIEPKIIGHQIGVNPLFTLLFVFLGFRLGGFFGMLILPIAITVLFTYYRRQFLVGD